MMEFLKSLFSSEGFMPHGHCLLWKPSAVWLHVISDSSITLAYYSIPITLLYFVRKRRDLAFQWVFLMFGAFIFGCGTTHLMEIWTLWVPTYWLDGIVKALTALLSLATAVAIVLLVPQVLSLRSPAELEAANRELEKQIAERKRVEETLYESERRYRLLAENSTDVIWTTDMDLRFTYLSPSVIRQRGYSVEEAMAQTFDEVLTPSSFKVAMDAFMEELAIERTEQKELFRSRTLELELIHKDGSTVWTESKVTFLRDRDSRPVGILGVTRDITERKRVEKALQEYAERLQALSHRLLNIQETERRNLACELHDEIGQVLTAVKINLRAIQSLAGENCLCMPRLEESIVIVDDALERVRNLSLDLRPSMLDDLGLVAALRWYVDRQSQRSGFIAKFVASPTRIYRLPPDVETVCFRITQEALTNVMRHAQAKHVRVELKHHGRELELVIRDDGIGFDINAVQKRAMQGMSCGLTGMQERVQLVGGRIKIKSEPERGTTIWAHFPLASSISLKEQGRKGDS